MNRKFTVPAAEKGHAFVLAIGRDLDPVLAVQQERVVGKDNTVQWGRSGLADRADLLARDAGGCRLTICQHLDGWVHGPHVVGRFSASGAPLQTLKKARAPRCGNEAPRKAGKTQTTKASFPLFPPRLEIRRKAKAPDSHIPTATTAAGKV